MTEEPFGVPPPRRARATFTLIALNIGIYIIAEWAAWYRQWPVDWYFALSKEGLRHGYLWQLLTFQFLHAPLSSPLPQALLQFDIPWHLLLNCWGIYVFGPPVELTLGRRNFVSLYLLGGVMGGLLQIAASVMANRFGGPVVGASAGLFGLVAAFTMLFPDTRMTVLVFFVIPVRMTANTLLTVAALITVVGMLFPFGNIAHAAHLGGLVTGLAYLRWKLARLRHR